MQMASEGKTGERTRVEAGTGVRELAAEGPRTAAAAPRALLLLPRLVVPHFFTLHVQDLLLQVASVWQPRPLLRPIVKQGKAGRINSLRLF